MNTSATANSPEKPLPSDTFLNVAAYKFASLGGLEDLRGELRTRCLDLDLKGTILLSPEGINLFLAGVPTSVDDFLDYLTTMPEFLDLEVKRSYSDKLPFRRMLVRLKKEIIPCGAASIRPQDTTSPKLGARELKQWLDEGRDIRLLDVRNNYEFELGTFRGAEQLDLRHFREFGQAIERIPENEKQQPVVMFCTGGIRCEKAGPLMEQAGFEHVYQLDGGILKYFEECGGEHYEGDCFVFDGRVAVDSHLQPTGNLLCFACQAVLTADDVASGKFLFGQYCPRCYQEPRQRRKAEYLQRQQRIRTLADAQPGCQPYDNVRKIHVPGRFAGHTLIDFLSAWLPNVSRGQWLQWLEQELITGTRVGRPDQVVREGECFIQHMPDTVEPMINPNIELLHEDSGLVVVNKPAPLPCHPSGRFNRNSLVSILAGAYPNEKLRVAHRLDALATGLVVLCRKYQAARYVQPQFAEQQVHKGYLARVQGHPDWQQTTCNAAISAEAQGAAGRRRVTDDGQSATTHFRVVRRFDDQTALLQAIPQTGRTHQIRLHLAHLGHAICGDDLYATDAPPSVGGATATESEDAVSAELCLHARQLSLIHPEPEQSVTYVAPLPEWARR